MEIVTNGFTIQSGLEIVGAFALIASLVPYPKVNKFGQVLKVIVDILGANIGHARNYNFADIIRSIAAQHQQIPVEQDKDKEV